MTAPVVTERPDISVTALSAVLKLRGISAVPIVDQGALVGIVSTTDILRAPRIARARDIMTAPVVTISVDDPLEDVAARIAAARIHRVVALEGTRVAGIISARDVLTEVKKAKIMTPIAEVMSAPVRTIEVGAGIEEAMRAVANGNVHGVVVVDGTIYRAAAYAVSMSLRRILVVEHRRLVGIVSCLDLVRILGRASTEFGVV